jgi:hypothetical protein
MQGSPAAILVNSQQRIGDDPQPIRNFTRNLISVNVRFQ